MAGNSNLDDPDLANLQSSFDEQQAKITALRAIIRQTEAVNDMKHATAQEKVKNIAQRLTHFKTKVTTSRLNRASSTGLSASSSALNISDMGGRVVPGPPPDLSRPDARGTVPFQRGRSESSGMEKCSLLRQQIEQNRLKMAERESSQREIEEKVIDLRHKLEATQQTLGRSTTELDVSGLRDESRRYSSFLCSTPAEPCQQLEKQSAPEEDQFNEELSRFEHGVRQTQAKRSSDEMLERRLATLEDSLHEKETIIDSQLRALATLVNDLFEEGARAGPLLVPDILNMQASEFGALDSNQNSMKLLQQSYNISSDEAASRLRDSYGYDPLGRAAEYIEPTRKSVLSDNSSRPKTPTDESTAQQLHDAHEKIAALEQALSVQEAETERLNQQLADLRQSLEEKTIELNVMTANVSVLQEKLKTSGPKPLFPRTADEELETETSKLKQQLDESNKNMIKCKLKIKQLQKQVDTFKQTSNVHEQVARLTEELGALTAERAAEGAGGAEPHTSVTPQAAELQKRIEMLERTCQNQATAMQLLEEQKNDLSEDLCRTRHELQTLSEHVTVTDGGENGRIASQMLSIELEEKLEQCLADKSELARVQHGWKAERAELQRQLQRYADENAELVSRIDKLSLEKVSSAESIEILENLTLREKQEMEGTEKQPEETVVVEPAPTVDETLTREDLNDSLLKLMEESKELMDKVELFTDERREVLEKLDAISIENRAYVCELDKLKEANEQLRTYSDELATAKTELERRLRTIDDEKHTILGTVGVRPAGDGDGEPVEAGDAAFNANEYQQSLQALEAESTSYGKCKDKQKKMQIAKKLATTVKPVVTMGRQLLDEYTRIAVTHRMPIVERADDTVDAATISTLETKLSETTKCLEAKASEVGLLQEQVARLKHELQVAADDKCSDDEPELLKVELMSKNDEIALLRKDIDALVDAKSAELLQFQQRLLDAQKENRQLTVTVAELQRELEQARTCSTSDEELQHKQETIDTLNAQLIELYRTLESHQDELDATRTHREQVEQKNEELLEKLKKFAANLKKKNAQCTELERDVERLTRELNERTVADVVEQPVEPAASETLRDENEQLTQKLHHLNNELHRLLENKYQLESEREIARSELVCHAEQLTATQEELERTSEELHATQQELERKRAELHTAQEELAAKGVKIEKCKAIIKEKIKEAQRLQERERRAAYLEDELRMAQSKLEDFHNQTLLLGRLKSEKEEMNACARQEHEQRETLQRELNHAAAWVRRYCAKWCRDGSDRIEAPPPTTDPSVAWLTELAETDRHIGETLANRTQELRTVEARLKEYAERATTLESELGRVRGMLEEVAVEKDTTIERLRAELQQAHTESQEHLAQLQSATAKLAQRDEMATTELETLRAERAHLDEQVAKSDRTIAQLTGEREAERTNLQQQNAQLAEQIVALRADLASLETALRDERARLQELSAANESLCAEAERLREQLLAEQATTEQIGRQLAEEKQQKEQLNEAIRQRDLEVESLRGQCEQLRTEQSEQLNEAIRQRDLEVESLRNQCEQLRTEQSEQLNEAIRQKDLEVESLRGQCEQLRTEQTEQLNEALRQKDLEMESLWEQRRTQYIEELQKKEQEVETAWTQKHERLVEELHAKQREIETVCQEKEALVEQLQAELLRRDDDSDVLRKELHDKLLDEVRKHNLELEELRAQLLSKDQEMQEKGQGLQSLLDERVQQVDDLRVQLDEMKNALDCARAGNEQQTVELAQLRETVARLEQQTQQDRTNLSILNSLNGALNEDLDLQQQHSGVAEQRYQALQEQHEETKRALEQAEARSQQLTVELRAKEQECADLVSAREQKQPECALDMWDDGDGGWGTSASTAALEATVREKDDQIRQHAAEKELMQQEITDLKVKSGKLLRKLKECKVKMDAAAGTGTEQSDERVAELEAKLQEAEQERVALVRAKDALDVKLDMLEEACEKLTEVKEHQDKQIALLRDSTRDDGDVWREKVRQCTATLQERESEVAHLNAKLSQLTGELEAVGELRRQLFELQEVNARLEAAGGKQPVSSSSSQETAAIELQLAELERTNRQLEEEKAEMAGELEVLNQQILHDLQFEDRLQKALLELDAKGVEIRMLRATLDQFQQQGPVTDGAIEPEPAVRVQAEEQQTAAVIPAHLQEVLERQELEIVTLKEQLAVRSAEYARLAARVDPTKLFAAGLGSTANDPPKPQQPEQQPAGDRVPRAELELALYMIYQRDMRCDELELELRNLLQERDTLQLRLSNALRTHEEFKLRFAGPNATEHEYGTSGECSIDASPDRSLTGLGADERPVSSLSGPQDLTSKLSELHSISYSKEKRWQEEREDRNRQLTLIQRDLANMPVEAAAKIAGTEVSADTEPATQQSASTVLLNWILGKKLKQLRGMTMRALPWAGREPPTVMRELRWAAYPSVSGVASDCSFLLTCHGEEAGRENSIQSRVFSSTKAGKLGSATNLAGDEDLLRLEPDAGVDADVLAAAVRGVHDEPLVEDEIVQVGRLVPERIGRQAVGEGDEPVREVVLAEPGEDALLLHIRPSRHVHEQIAELLPVPAHVDRAGPHLRVLPRHRHGRGERAVDAEHDALGAGRHDRQVEIDRRVVSPHHHLHREDAVPAGLLRRHQVRDASGLIGRLRRQELPFAGGRITHHVYVDSLAGERYDVERAVHEPCDQPLGFALAHNHIVRPVVGGHVLQLDRGALFVPLFARLRRSEAGDVLLVAVPTARAVLVEPADLLEDERDHIARLPVAGVEEMGKGVGREVAETFRAVERVVEPLRAPPALLQLVDRGERHVVDHARGGTLDGGVGKPPPGGGRRTRCRRHRAGVGEQLRAGLDQLEQMAGLAIAERVLRVPRHVHRREHRKAGAQERLEPGRGRIGRVEQVVELGAGRLAVSAPTVGQPARGQYHRQRAAEHEEIAHLELELGHARFARRGGAAPGGRRRQQLGRVQLVRFAAGGEIRDVVQPGRLAALMAGRPTERIVRQDATHRVADQHDLPTEPTPLVRPEEVGERLSGMHVDSSGIAPIGTSARFETSAPEAAVLNEYGLRLDRMPSASEHTAGQATSRSATCPTSDG
uniref:Uncharacterized protein n=1 Tax=Anopheles farauti TaxID=69004 RepID=A0A182QYT3_9DIPT